MINKWMSLRLFLFPFCSHPFPFSFPFPAPSPFPSPSLSRPLPPPFPHPFPVAVNQSNWNFHLTHNDGFIMSFQHVHLTNNIGWSNPLTLPPCQSSHSQTIWTSFRFWFFLQSFAVMEKIQLTLPKSKSHKLNNRLSRRSISSPLFFISFVLDPT